MFAIFWAYPQAKTKQDQYRFSIEDLWENQ